MVSIYPKIGQWLHIARCANIPLIKSMFKKLAVWSASFLVILFGSAIFAGIYLQLAYPQAVVLCFSVWVLIQQFVLVVFKKNINKLSTGTVFGITAFTIAWYVGNTGVNNRAGSRNLARIMNPNAPSPSKFRLFIAKRWWLHQVGDMELEQYPTPDLNSFQFTNDGATAVFRVNIPGGQDRRTYERMKEKIGSGIPPHQNFGKLTHLSVDPWAGDPLQSMKITMSFKSLPGFMESTDFIPMVSPSEFMIGENYVTTETWDTSKHAHAILFGTSGGGKSNLLRIIAGQAKASKYWKSIVIDAQGSGQWSAFDDDDEHFELFEMPEDETLGTEYVNAVLDNILAEIRPRAELLKKHKVDNFKDLPEEVQVEYKRWLIVIDEGNAVVSKIPDKDLQIARKNFCHWIEKNAKQIRKWGGHILYSDQVTHIKNTYLDSGVFENFLRYFLVNNLDDDTKGIIGAIEVPVLPPAADAPSAAIAGVRNEEGAQEIRIPLVKQPVFWEHFGAKVREDGKSLTDAKIEAWQCEKEAQAA